MIDIKVICPNCGSRQLIKKQGDNITVCFDCDRIYGNHQINIAEIIRVEFISFKYLGLRHETTIKKDSGKYYVISKESNKYQITDDVKNKISDIEYDNIMKNLDSKLFAFDLTKKDLDDADFTILDGGEISFKVYNSKGLVKIFHEVNEYPENYDELYRYLTSLYEDSTEYY